MKLFQIEKIGSMQNEYFFRSMVDSSHDIFNGHFPEHPVVPGVCTMAMIKDCCESILSRPIRFDTVKEVKFLSAIVPSIHADLRVNIHLDEELNLKAQVLCADQTMMKLKAVIL